MGHSGDGDFDILESSVTGSNPGSLLRSKSTRRERRCVAASSRLVGYIAITRLDMSKHVNTCLVCLTMSTFIQKYLDRAVT